MYSLKPINIIHNALLYFICKKFWKYEELKRNPEIECVLSIEYMQMYPFMACSVYGSLFC